MKGIIFFFLLCRTLRDQRDQLDPLHLGGNYEDVPHPSLGATDSTAPQHVPSTCYKPITCLMHPTHVNRREAASCSRRPELTDDFAPLSSVPTLELTNKIETVSWTYWRQP